MATELRAVSLQNGYQHLTRLEKVKNWVHEHPTTAKILKIAGLILGIGLLISIPFAIPLGMGALACIAVTGITAIAASIFLFTCRSQDLPRVGASLIKPDMSSIELWLYLEQKTEAQLKELEFLSKEDLNHRFVNIHCPKKTAVTVAGQYLHANTVGKGIAQRSFIASQAPLEKDYEIFWKAVFNSNPTIFDLTTIKDQTQGGITKYYPDKLNKTVKYGSISVKLIKVRGHTHTYQIKNTETKGVKTIKRCHYTDWKDCGTISLPELHALTQEVETLSPDPKDLLWVHCRAGIGRTGSLITALILKEKIEIGEVNKKNLESALIDIVVELRKQRGPDFVQHEGQLELIRRYGNFLITH